MVTVVDASVWISGFLPDDVNYGRSVAWLNRQTEVGEELVAPRFLLVEVAAGISRRSRNPDAGIHFMELLLDNPTLTLVSLTDDVIEHVARVGAGLHLRAGDAFYIATAVIAGARLVTWDREQLTRGATLVPTTTPADDLAEESTDF